MMKKQYIQPRTSAIECGVTMRLLEGSDTGEINDDYKYEGEEDLARAQRFQLEQNVNALRGKGVWDSEW